MSDIRPTPDDPYRLVRRYLELLRGTNPSPKVLAAMERIQAEMDAGE